MTLGVSETPPKAKRAARSGLSAVLVLGALSGIIAGVIYLAISLPLVIFTVNAEQNEWTRRSVSATDNIDRALQAGMTLTAQSPERLGVDWIVVRTIGVKTPPLYAFGKAEGQRVSAQLCSTDTPTTVVDSILRRWAAHCRVTNGQVIAAGKELEHQSGRTILYINFMLALLVGLLTTIVQARLLRPLSRMSNALERVAQGERGVRLPLVGLHELDTLVDSINDAAENVEHRQDTISARIAVVQEMARLVAHEVRNPLQSLELLTSLISIEDDPEERFVIASSIRQEVQALDQVVHRLLKRGSAGGALDLKQKLQGVTPLVEHVVRVKTPAAERRGVRLSIGLVSQKMVMIDAAMLGRALENLVVNALQAIPDKDGQIRLSVFEHGDSLWVAIDDNGPGVDPELGDSIFDVNVTEKKDGHGLGLALTRAVLVAHGGSIKYTTSPLGGARFLARLPRYEESNTND
ncbi:MAG: HAMP domain-containing protein [Rhodobacterales bacterium]|nr:HAMP domain-containing protein [Rhodobacterales bacterium]